LKNKIDEDFEEWKPFFQHLMEYKRLKEENQQLLKRIKHLESQVYGGTTK
jgi:hypothetical protein